MYFNNKGFTLIELLGVIAVLVAILLVAIPNISSVLERNKNKIDINKEKNVISSAEIYFSNKDCYRTECKIAIEDLLTSDLLANDELIYSNGKKITDTYKYIKYNNNSFELLKEVDATTITDCICN